MREIAERRSPHNFLGVAEITKKAGGLKNGPPVILICLLLVTTSLPSSRRAVFIKKVKHCGVFLLQSEICKMARIVNQKQTKVKIKEKEDNTSKRPKSYNYYE